MVLGSGGRSHGFSGVPPAHVSSMYRIPSGARREHFLSLWYEPCSVAIAFDPKKLRQPDAEVRASLRPRVEYQVEGSRLTGGVTSKMPRPCRGSAPAAPEVEEGSAKTVPTTVVEEATFQVSFPE